MLFFGIGLLVLLLLGLPVAFSLGFAGMSGMFFLAGGTKAMSQMPFIAYKALDEFVLSAIPLYILMSQILLTGKIGNDLYEVGNKWLRHLPGGLGVATVAACAVFAAISGSSVTTAVTIGVVAIPEMIARGYDKKTVLGLVAAGGTLGILIPPSIPMILYGSITGESVGKLFMAGMIPGVLMAFLFIVLIVFLTARKLEPQPKASLSERMGVLKKSFWGLLLPVLVIGGIYTGAFTPTEAAAIGTLYSIVITFFIYRTLTWRDIPEIMKDTVKTNSMILAIMIGAMIFGYVLTLLRIPQMLTEAVTALNVNRWVVIVFINLLLLVLGCFLETVSIILITLPILYPIITSLGFDPIWFAVMMVINMELALITPPVGMNLFVIQGISPGTRMAEILRGVLPFALLIVLTMILIAFFPNIALWLPNWVQ